MQGRHNWLWYRLQPYHVPDKWDGLHCLEPCIFFYCLCKGYVVQRYCRLPKITGKNTTSLSLKNNFKLPVNVCIQCTDSLYNMVKSCVRKNAIVCIDFHGFGAKLCILFYRNCSVVMLSPYQDNLDGMIREHRQRGNFLFIIASWAKIWEILMWFCTNCRSK